MQKCLAGQGFDFEVSTFTGVDTAAQEWRSFGLWNPVEAAKYGYDLPPDPVTAADQALNRTMSAAETAAFGPCVQKANATFVVPDQMARLSAGNLSNEALSETLADPAGKSLIRAWQGCMTAQGIAVGGSAAGPLGVDTTGMSHRQQIATAVADVECKTRGSVIQQLADIDAGYQQRRIARYQGTLASQLAQADAVYAAAAAYVRADG